MMARLFYPALFSALFLAIGCSANPPAAEKPSPASATTSAVPFPAAIFTFPVADGTLPREPELMPGAPRNYRGGSHQGVDIYYKSGSSMVACSEPVINAAEGWVVRADTDWKAMTEKEYDLDTQRLKKEYNETLLDRLRGRQVWVRTPDGITIRYCHLESVAPGITTGIKVNPGVIIGGIGNSGTADGAKITAQNCHLHLEVWMPDGKFLGDGLSAGETRARWSALFGISVPLKK